MTEEVQEHLQTSIFVNFHHTSWYPPCTHTLLYPSCAWTMLGVVFTYHFIAMDKSWIVFWWFSKTSSTTCAVITFFWSAGLRGAIIIMDANPLLNSVHPLHKWCALSVHHHQTPALTGSEIQGWKCFPYINCITPQSFLHDRVSTIITTAHKIIPQIAWLTGCCTICCMLPLSQSVPPTTK